MLFILLFVKNSLQFDTIHDFLEWPRTSSNPANINWLQGYTRIKTIWFVVPQQFFFYLESEHSVILKEISVPLWDQQKCDASLKVSKDISW